MRKIAWPWIGSTSKEMGSKSPSGDFTDKDEGPHTPPDSFVPEKSVLDDQETIMTYEGGIMSPVEGVSFADDDKVSVEISNEEGLIANFSCDIASSIQQKMAGLQPYNNLSESAGLVFAYEKPEDVIYHMGTVSFPIDIIFVGKNNKIKKIYKDIKPGTLGTYGCGNVKTVLEICGGLSDRLGFGVGNVLSFGYGRKYDISGVDKLNKVAKRLEVKKDIIVQYSGSLSGGIYNWNNFPILSINKRLSKFANDSGFISDLVRNFASVDNRDIYAFDFDGLIEESPMVRVYKTSEVVGDKVPYIRIDGHTVSVDKADDGNEIYRDVHIYELSKDSILKGESILASLNKSFSEFLNDKKIIEDASKIFNQIRSAAEKSNSRIVIITRSPNPEYLGAVICSRINLQFGSNIDAEVLKVSSGADGFNVISELKSAFGNKNINFYGDKNILKRAGSPVSDAVKEKARKIYKLLNSAKKISEQSLDNMKKNVQEYQKINSDQDAVSKSKGQYNQSVRGNTRIVKAYLIKIRDAIRLFDQIRDVSTTMEVVDSLVTSSKKASDGVEEIFNLIDQIDSPNFVMMLSQKVGEYERMIEDLHFTIERGTNYINSDILGLIILSD